MFIFDFNWQIQQFLNQFWWQINTILIVFLGILIYLSYKKPLGAVILTIIFLPTYLFRSYIWFLPFTFLELCILITFLGWLVKILNLKSQDFSLDPTRARWLLKQPISNLSYFKWPILLILIAATISLFITPNLRAAAGLWKAYFIEPILFFIVLINVIKTPKDKEKIFWALGISTLAISLLATFQKFTGFGIAEPIWLNSPSRRVTSIFTSPNAVGLYLGPIFIIYFGWLMKNLKSQISNLKNLLVFFFLILMTLAIIFTKSQGAYLAVLVGIIFLAFFGWSKKWTTILVIGLIIISLTIPVFREKMLPVITFQDIAGKNRLILWQGSLNYLTTSVKSSVLGAGIFGFPQIQEQFRQPLKMEPLIYPHNIILNFWLDLGLLGLVGFVWLIIKFFKFGFQSHKLYAISPKPSTISQMLIILAAMIVILVQGLVDVPYFKNDLAVLFWLIIGLII